MLAVLRNKLAGNLEATILMKRNSIVFALATLLVIFGSLPMWSQTVGVPVEGKVTVDGKPLPNAQIMMTSLDNGKVYKTKSDKGGNIAFMGAAYGSYKVEVINEKGEKLFSEQTFINADNTTSENFLKIEITGGGAPITDDKPGAPSTPAPKLTKEQLAKIKADNDKIAGLNALIAEAQSARQAQDWPKAEGALKKLIAAAPDSSRWDFYSALGEAQTRSNEFPDAVKTYDKGVEIAQSIAGGSTPPDPKNPNSSPAAAKAGAVRMLTSQGNDYLKMEKPDDAIASLKKAADMDPSVAVNQYNLCGVAFTAGRFDDAKGPCNKYLQLEPSGAHAEEVKGFVSQIPK
jgi:tetratricopeptide (TPR) repeat protein